MTTIKFRRDTSANWTSVNPIPAQGEPCYETDTGKLKIGNGSDNYVTLPYVSDGGGSAGDLPIASSTTLGGVKIGNNLSITADGTLSATGGSAPTNMVTTDTEQTITGKKSLPLSTTLGRFSFKANGFDDNSGKLIWTLDSGQSAALQISRYNYFGFLLNDSENWSIRNDDDRKVQTWSASQSNIVIRTDRGNGLKIVGKNDGRDLELTNINGDFSFLRSKDIDNNTIKIVNGVLTANVSTDLPIATATTLGGIKVGNNLSITEDGTLSAIGGSSGTTDYTQLENKPQINSVELTGNKTLNDLGIQPKGNYLTALPDNAVTTDTDQTISGVKTFTNGVTTASIYPAGEITFKSTSTSRYINNVDSIAGGYHSQNGYITFKGDTTLVGDNKLILDGRAGGLKLTAASSANITCENELVAPNIVTTANGTIKLAHPMNNASGLITLSNNYGQLSIASSLGGTNNLLGVTRGTAYALIDGDNIITKDKDGNVHTYINSQNIDTTYMKWDSNTGKLKVDTAAVAGLAMPSSTVVNLTLGASGTIYTPPADGYMKLNTSKIFTGWIKIDSYAGCSSYVQSGQFLCSAAVANGKSFKIWYNFSSGDTSKIVLSFIYCNGTVPTNTEPDFG